MFRRRDPRSYSRMARDALWPRGGWGRAATYLKHRVRRLPDSPSRIGRGIFAGVFVCFTPFFGLHFFFAAVMARLIRGNIFASLIATFFGNPVTFFFIAWVSLHLGHWMLGSEVNPRALKYLWDTFAGAGGDLWDNLLALFGYGEMHWERLIEFWHAVFLPYLIGGILPGLAAGAASFYLSVPVVAAYQKRRAAAGARKLQRLREKAAAEAASRGKGVAG